MTTRMRSKHTLVAGLMCVLLMAYVTGYIAYRMFGPCQITWPRGDDNPVPVILIRYESRSDILLYRTFQPCVIVEELYLRLKYANAA